MSQLYNEIARYAVSPAIFFLRASERNPHLDKMRLRCQCFLKFAVLIPVERTIRPTLAGQFIDLLIQFVSLRYLPADRSVLSALLGSLIDRLNVNIRENFKALEADLFGKGEHIGSIQTKIEHIERERDRLLILIAEYKNRNLSSGFTAEGDPAPEKYPPVAGDLGVLNSEFSTHLGSLIDRLDTAIKENWNALQADLVGEVSNPALIQAKAELIERQREQLLILIEEHGKRNPPENFTPGGDPPVCAEYVEMHRKYLAAGDDLRLAFADVEVQNAEVNIPGGIANGGNRCYIHVVLQALSYVYSSSIEALRDNHPLSFLKEPIKALRHGELISEKKSVEIARMLRRAECVRDSEGEQGCSIEVLGNILGKIDASMMQMQIPINLTGEVTETKSEVEEGQVIEGTRSDFVHWVSLSPKAEAMQPLSELMESEFRQKVTGSFSSVLGRKESRGTEGEEITFLDSSKLLQVLPICLRRGGFGEKNTTPVQVDDFFVLPGQYLTDNQPIVYQLKCFISHHGEEEKSGHYTFFFRHRGKWYEANDSRVGLVSFPRKKKAQNEGLLYFFNRVL